MRFLLNGIRRERHRQVCEVLGLDVLNDGAVRCSHHQRNPEKAAQKGVQVARTNRVRIRHDLEHVLRRPDTGHLRPHICHAANRAGARNRRHAFLKSQVCEPGRGGVRALQQVDVVEIRVQNAAAGQEGHAVVAVRDVISGKFRPVVDAAVVPASEIPKFDTAYGQTFQERLRLHRSRQVRSAVETPTLPLQPRAGHELFLHGACRPPSTNAR